MFLFERIQKKRLKINQLWLSKAFDLTLHLWIQQSFQSFRALLHMKPFFLLLLRSWISSYGKNAIRNHYLLICSIKKFFYRWIMLWILPMEIGIIFFAQNFWKFWKELKSKAKNPPLMIPLAMFFLWIPDEFVFFSWKFLHFRLKR